MRADCIVVASPAFDDDLSLPQRVEDFAVEQLVTQATSLTPIWRIASTMPWPCETRTSTCRSFVTISSGLCLFLGIAVLLHVQRHTSGRTTFAGVDQVPELAAKRLGLLKEAVPGIARVLVLSYLADPIAPLQVKALK